MHWWAGKLVRIVGVTLRVEGHPPRPSEKAVMIAANHISWLDIFAVMAVWPTHFVAKSEIRDWPIAGWIAERAGTLFIRRDRRRDTARMNEQVHAVLGDGYCVGIFPEGTTSEGDRLLKFHTSLFEPALANGAHLHPVAIRYEHADGRSAPEVAYAGELSFMQSMSRVIAARGVAVRVMFGARVDCASMRDRREAARITRERIASLLGLDPEGNPPGTHGGHRAGPP